LGASSKNQNDLDLLHFDTFIQCREKQHLGLNTIRDGKGTNLLIDDLEKTMKICLMKTECFCVSKKHDRFFDLRNHSVNLTSMSSLTQIIHSETIVSTKYLQSGWRGTDTYGSVLVNFGRISRWRNIFR
jgi:hypothetical protein